MNTQVRTAPVTEPPVWFITGCSTGFTTCDPDRADIDVRVRPCLRHDP